jgi:hypothetical protein
MADWVPAQNRFLAAVRNADQAAESQLRVGLESVELKLHAKVMGPDRPIRHVYFPETGSCPRSSRCRRLDGGSQPRRY